MSSPQSRQGQAMQKLFEEQQLCLVEIAVVAGSTGSAISSVPTRYSTVGATSTLFRLIACVIEDSEIRVALMQNYGILIPDDLTQVSVKVCRPGDKQYEATKHDFHYWFSRGVDKDIWEDKRRYLCPDRQRIQEERWIPRIELYVNETKVQAGQHRQANRRVSET